MIETTELEEAMKKLELRIGQLESSKRNTIFNVTAGQWLSTMCTNVGKKTFK